MQFLKKSISFLQIYLRINHKVTTIQSKPLAVSHLKNFTLNTSFQMIIERKRNHFVNLIEIKLF